ncbi:MAG: putative glutamine amidotransferase [Acidimicrobiaceae bacterium]|jgi:putative glutamine amidotransferase|nr:MAG: putative glutamine amidotransferase [Acidimicrobiaceae bacterium]
MSTWRRVMPTFVSERTDLYTLGTEYPQAVLDAGGLPLLLPHHRAEDAARVLEGFDGLVMVGGDDIHPKRYGRPDEGKSKGVVDSADESDLAFASAAIELGIPLFAICRGYQALNVAMGGTLHQDSTSDGGIHGPISDVPADVMSERHPITMAEGSRLATAYGRHDRVVNSIHHQSIETVAPGFHPVAWAPDGTVEAIEPDDAAARVLAVQWHPEKIAAEGDHVLFRYFIDELVRG